MTYRSKMAYAALPDTPENAETLAEWGYVSPMGPTGMIVVRDLRNQMISGILSQDDFDDLFEEIPDSN
jgi:hypothetical protein